MAADLEPNLAGEEAGIEQNEGLYCWPWFGVLVNVQRNQPNNAHNCDYWMDKFSEYAPLEIETVGDVTIVLKFGKDWIGFKNAMEFDKFFKEQGFSKKEWIERRASPGSSIYGWFAREDDYKSEGLLGDYLRRKGDLKTISDLALETDDDHENIVSNLVNEMDLTNENLDQVHIKYNENTLGVTRALEERGEVHHNFCEGMEAERGNTKFPPQATVGPIPNVGQEFQTLEDALDFYNQYAKQAGFSTRIGNNRKNKKTGEEVWKLFVCSKEGKTDETWQNKFKYAVERSGERNRVHTRCGCRARMSIVKSRDKNVWSVSKFVAEHNHVLATPGKVRRPLSSHRNVSTTKKALTQQMAEANILTCQQVQLLDIDAGEPRIPQGIVKRVLNEQEMLSLVLESKRQRLDSQSKELKRHETLNLRECEKLAKEMPENVLRSNALQMPPEKQRATYENAQRLVEELKREKEEARKTILELERKLAEEKKTNDLTNSNLQVAIEEQRKANENSLRLAEEQRKTNENVQRLAEEQRKTNENVRRLAEEQRKTNDNVLRLVEEQKREKEVALKKILELERKLEEEEKHKNDQRNIACKTGAEDHRKADENTLRRVEERMRKEAKLTKILEEEKHRSERQKLEKEILELKHKLEEMKHKHEQKLRELIRGLETNLHDI